MALEWSLTKQRHTKNLPVPADTVIMEEGVPVVQVIVDRREAAAPAGYNGGNIFLGFSFSETMRPQTKAMVETFLITSTNYTHTLSRYTPPLTGQISVIDRKTNTIFTTSATTPPAQGQYYLMGAVIEFNPSDAGSTVEIGYRYTPSTLELQFEDRVPYTFSTAPEKYGQIGVILAGDVYTDQYDARINWADPTAGHRLIADPLGVVSMGTTGIIINGFIIQAPNENNPFLGVRFNQA